MHSISLWRAADSSRRVKSACLSHGPDGQELFPDPLNFARAAGRRPHPSTTSTPARRHLAATHDHVRSWRLSVPWLQASTSPETHSVYARGTFRLTGVIRENVADALGISYSPLLGKTRLATMR
jgi:hypothetical protein